jgi:hypothetical protein
VDFDSDPFVVDPEAVDPPELLRDVGKALEIFAEAEDDRAPFMFGDGGEPSVWLVYAPFYGELARAQAWVRADAAVQAAGPDPDPALLAARDQAAGAALDRDGAIATARELRLVHPDDVVRDLAEVVRHVRAGTLAPVAVGRGAEPEAVLVTTEAYRELVRAHMLWHQAPEFLATLGPIAGKPLAKSQPLDLERFMSADPVSREIWERIQARKAERPEE